MTLEEKEARMRQIVTGLDALRPYKGSIQKIDNLDEGTGLFYTVRKGDISVYLSTHDDYQPGDDEVIVSVYKNKEVLLDHAGSISECFELIKQKL